MNGVPCFVVLRLHVLLLLVLCRKRHATGFTFKLSFSHLLWLLDRLDVRLLRLFWWAFGLLLSNLGFAWVLLHNAALHLA